MVEITEIGADLFRLSVYVPEFDLQFNHFLVRDEQPLLFHAGFRAMFPALRQAVATLIEPQSLRYIAWSHFESDEIGGLNHWLELAPQAEPVCTFVGKVVTVDDFAIRPARALGPSEVLATGRYRFRFHPTPHLPHGWDAGLLFEETHRTLFCSDLLHQFGAVAPLSSEDLIAPSLAALVQMQQSPLASTMACTPQTQSLLSALAELQPSTLATMHGSSYSGDGGRMLREFGVAMQEVFGAA